MAEKQLEKNETDIAIGARVPKPLYAKILRRRREVQQLTGTEPSISALIRASLERDLAETIAQRRRAKPSRKVAA